MKKFVLPPMLFFAAVVIGLIFAASTFRHTPPSADMISLENIR